MREGVKKITQLVKRLPCLGITDPLTFLIIETVALELRYGKILKQKISQNSKE